jgi:hypothetical protein
MKTSKIYIVTFLNVLHQLGRSFETYPIRVRAFDIEDAQDKAITEIESIATKYGAIKSITRSMSTL